MSEPLVQPVSARSLLEDVRQLVREKNGLNISLSDPAGSSLTPVKHRVQALEHTPGKSHTTPTAVPKSQALSHSSSASWKQLHLETGKSAWQREEKSGDETLAGEQFLVSPGLVSGRQQPLLELPQVHSVQQAQHVVQTLQQQLFLELRRLQGARVLARQAAEQLYACQQQSSDATDMQAASPTSRGTEAQNGAEAECKHTLTTVQSHMFELSQEVSLIELALELAEARYNIMCAASGEQPVSPGSLLSSNMPHAGRQSMQKLLKPLSNTSYSTASRAEAAKAGHSHIGTEAQIVDIPECSPAQQSSYGSDITARPDEELHSPRSEADSSPSCHSITGSVAGPATPAATLAHAQPASSDSSGHSELTASVCPMSERDTAATERCTMSMSMSDNASSAFDVDPGLDEAIQACSDLIAEIKNEVDRKSSVKVLSHWQPRKWMFLGSALAVCTGAFATGSCLGLHASIINWFPT